MGFGRGEWLTKSLSAVMPGLGHRHGGLPLPCGERVGVRGFRIQLLCNPSPDALTRVDLSLWER
jgi:hypothetical protein